MKNSQNFWIKFDRKTIFSENFKSPRSTSAKRGKGGLSEISTDISSLKNELKYLRQDRIKSENEIDLLSKKIKILSFDSKKHEIRLKSENTKQREFSKKKESLNENKMLKKQIQKEKQMLLEEKREKIKKYQIKVRIKKITNDFTKMKTSRSISNEVYKSRIKNENLIIRNKNRELTENRKKCEKIKQYINKSHIAQMEKQKKSKSYLKKTLEKRIKNARNENTLLKAKIRSLKEKGIKLIEHISTLSTTIQ